MDSTDFVPNPQPAHGIEVAQRLIQNETGSWQAGCHPAAARIAEARKQVTARPQDPGAAYNLARVYASLDMIDEAFEWLGKALKLGFDNIQFVREDPGRIRSCSA